MERASLTNTSVCGLVQRLYGLTVTKQRTLSSYDDVNIHVTVQSDSQNEHITEVSADGYVLKILNTIDSTKVEFIGAMHSAIEMVSNAGIKTSQPLRNVYGQLYSTEFLKSRTGKECQFLVRLFQYVPGDILEGKPYSPQVCFEVGQLAGRLSNILKDFDHPGLVNHSRHWNLREVANLDTDKIDSIPNTENRRLVGDVLEQFRRNVIGNAELMKGAVHADLNEGNIIIQADETATQNGSSMEYHVKGVLDFGDLVKEYVLYEISIAIAYMMIESGTLDPIEVAGHTLAGYIKEFDLPAPDCNVLKECICARMAQSFTYGNYEHMLDPSNTHCLKTSTKGWPILWQLWKLSKQDLYSRWMEILQSYSLSPNFDFSSFT